jgi:hypothetical protein
MMLSNWQQEKATAALVDEAQALADKLAVAKPHVIDSHAAAAQFWAASYVANGQNLNDLIDWNAPAVRRFASAAETKIAAPRKQRAYDSSDGLTVWLHTARAVTEPRIAPAVRDMWRQISKATPNADTMAEEQLEDAGLPAHQGRTVPKSFRTED